MVVAYIWSLHLCEMRIPADVWSGSHMIIHRRRHPAECAACRIRQGHHSSMGRGVWSWLRLQVPASELQRHPILHLHQNTHTSDTPTRGTRARMVLSDLQLGVLEHWLAAQVAMEMCRGDPFTHRHAALAA